MSTKEDIAVSYDVSNDFFALWLDEQMNYSCALFEDTDDLELAQKKKLHFMADMAHVQPGMRVVDIGCGWGGNLRYLVNERGVREANGITLSTAQFEHIQRQRLPATTTAQVSYRDYHPEEPFDAAISIGMFEHIATPEEARDGRSVEVYRDYFRRVWRWTVSGAWFSLQTVIGGVLPRTSEDLRELEWVTRAIFPGAISPRLGDIAQAVSPCWEIMELHTRRGHYARTTGEWLRRLQAQRDVICGRWEPTRFEEYERYLRACVMAFERGYQSLVQIALRRIGPDAARRPCAADNLV
jgi:cyclopropane-fatty-acyl-phospholipid synthase